MVRLLRRKQALRFGNSDNEPIAFRWNGLWPRCLVLAARDRRERSHGLAGLCQRILGDRRGQLRRAVVARRGGLAARKRTKKAWRPGWTPSLQA